MCLHAQYVHNVVAMGKALMSALMAVENDGGEALQAYLVHEHEENSKAKDGSALMPEAMRARARVPRYESTGSSCHIPFIHTRSCSYARAFATKKTTTTAAAAEIPLCAVGGHGVLWLPLRH